MISFDLLDNSYDMMSLATRTILRVFRVEKEFVLRLAGLCAEKGIYLMIDEIASVNSSMKKKIILLWHL